MEEIKVNNTEELEAIAKKYGVKNVFKITANVDMDSDETATAFFKWPGRNAISSSMAIQNRDPLMAKLIVLQAGFLEGDRRILDDEYTFCNACTVLDDVIGFRMAEIKKN
jgi:hypothetical protein